MQITSSAMNYAAPTLRSNKNETCNLEVHANEWKASRTSVFLFPHLYTTHDDIVALNHQERKMIWFIRHLGDLNKQNTFQPQFIFLSIVKEFQHISHLKWSREQSFIVHKKHPPSSSSMMPTRWQPTVDFSPVMNFECSLEKSFLVGTPNKQYGLSLLSEKLQYCHKEIFPVLCYTIKWN